MPIELIDSGVRPAVYHCPTCKKIAPPYGFHLNGGDLGIVGMVQYFTIFCAAQVEPADDATETPAKVCGAILAVQIMQYQPPRDPVQLAALHRAMMAGPGKPNA